MIAADPVLPAAPHLVGPNAVDLLQAAVAAAGGTVHRAETVQVQYRPGHDLVVRYDTEISWRGDVCRPETLLAGITADGPFDGTLPLEAGGLVAGVWRYPFDPALPGLAVAVTPHQVTDLLAGLVTGPLEIDVRAYRPVRRAVVRVRDRGGREIYVKVVPPPELGRIVDRHRSLGVAGLPVPDVLHADGEVGILVLSALPGTSLREVLLGSTTGWPGAAEYARLAADLATVASPAAPIADLERTATHHADVIAAVLPAERPRLDHILDALAPLAPTDPVDAVTIHGDFYEAQLMTHGGRISGLLDLDDVGPGNPLDDLATLLGHLHILRPATRRQREHLARYRAKLRGALAAPDDLEQLDLRTAAVLVGLATGPFRAQSAPWAPEVRRRLAAATRLTRSGREVTLASTR